MKRKRNDSESKLQQACVEWFNLQYPQHEMLLFAIPNGGSRNAIEGARLKREGVVSGVSDLLLSIPNENYSGFYIEMKVGNNKPTDNQIKFMNKVSEKGYKTQVIKSLDVFMRAVNNYLYYV